MSVVHFSAQELANVATYLASSRYAEPAYLRVVLADLVTFSEVNTKAHNARYNDDASPVTLVELIDAVSALLSERRFRVSSKADGDRAHSSMRLFDYNTEAEHHTPAYHAAMCRLLNAAHGQLLAQVEGQA
jgi:hypothetical protein